MLAAAAAVAAAFNLVCTGTETTRSIAGEKLEPYTHIYRVDLDKKKWCEEGCSVVRDVAEVQQSFLELEPRRNVDTAVDRDFFEWTIDRTTGRESMLASKGLRADIIILKWEGTCARQPFTGFPSPPTKF